VILGIRYCVNQGAVLEQVELPTDLLYLTKEAFTIEYGCKPDAMKVQETTIQSIQGPLKGYRMGDYTLIHY
jgi:hypothetical protein